MNSARIGVIGGTHGMGRWFAGFLRKRGLAVTVCDEKTALTPADLAGACDCVIVSVPIAATEIVIKTVGPFMRREALLMDLTSLKTAPVRAMLAYACCEVIGCHPLFGPKVRSIRGRSVVLCPARGTNWLPWLRSILGEAGAGIVESTPELHDLRMAAVQALNHLNSLHMGMALRDAGLSPTDLRPFGTPAFEQKMELVKKIFYPQVRLSAEIIMMNSDILRMIDQYEQSFSELKNLIRNNDTKGLMETMSRCAAALWPES